MGWPQITWIVLVVVGVVVHLLHHGQPTRISFWASFSNALLVAWLLWCGGFFSAHAADQIPLNAERYQRTLTRTAQSEWGLDAPVATLAAQIHQESRWNANARSPVGAQGLAQFMPSTADWIAQLYPNTLGTNEPWNPAWAMRAMVVYNRFNYQRITADSDCDRWAFTLSAYNGGLGWVQRDSRLAASRGLNPEVYWGAVETVNAGRSAANFRENRGYPKSIIHRWQPLYIDAGWGLGVCYAD